MDVNGPAPFLVPLQAVDVIQKQVFLAGQPILGFLERHHGYMSTRDRGLDGPARQMIPLADMASTSLSMKWP